MKRIKELYKPPILAAFGNPLLDMCARIRDLDILKKYGLSPNGEKELSESELEIFGEIRKRYKYHENHPTGSCLALINGENRSLVVHLCAANVYKPEDMDVADTIDMLRQVYMIYVESFFISHSFDVASNLLRLCRERKIPLVFNIGSVYMCKDFAKEVAHLAQNANIVVGNKEEFKALGKIMGVQHKGIKDIVSDIHKLSNKHDQFIDQPLGRYLENLGKILVVTDGKDSVTCVYGNLNEKPSIIEYEVPEVKADMVKDTTGAGDSFLAGFLAGLFVMNDLETCLAWGCWSAKQVIQLIGCQTPPYPSDGIHQLK
ncbi:hypothetical protein C0J52_21749 [Blattella germanica]|nr:hypothetical protein C0J52_21749 [Blattella germanica]